MKRIVVIACSLGVSACSSMPGTSSFMSSELPAVTVQFDSRPTGAEARLPTGQNCHTPCALPVTSTEFAVTFTHPGYLPQTVPVRAAPAPEQNNPFAGPPEPRLVPNPVFAELQPVAPQRARRTPAVAQSRPKPAPRTAPTAAAPPPPAPAPAPASPWPPPPAPR